MVRLNRAVAEGPGRGLALLDGLEERLVAFAAADFVSSPSVVHVRVSRTPPEHHGEKRRPVDPCR